MCTHTKCIHVHLRAHRRTGTPHSDFGPLSILTNQYVVEDSFQSACKWQPFAVAVQGAVEWLEVKQAESLSMPAAQVMQCPMEDAVIVQ